MSRIVLNDERWGQLEPIMKSIGCKFSKNNRNAMEAILWKIRTGSTWRDVPGNPPCFEITGGGQVHYSQVASQLIDKVSGEILIADRGYDSNRFVKKQDLKI